MIAKFDPINGKRLLEIELPDEENIQRISAIFQNLHCTEETYLILDDFWKFKAPNLGEFLMVLSKHDCKNLHIIVATQLLPRQVHKNIIQNHRLFLVSDEGFDSAPFKQDPTIFGGKMSPNVTIHSFPSKDLFS